MDMYEVLNLLFLDGTFLIALLAYIDCRGKQAKINKPTLSLASTGRFTKQLPGG